LDYGLFGAETGDFEFHRNNFAYRLRMLTGRGGVHAGKPVDVDDQDRGVRT
jgi:hypothetical protein